MKTIKFIFFILFLSSSTSLFSQIDTSKHANPQKTQDGEIGTVKNNNQFKSNNANIKEVPNNPLNFQVNTKVNTNAINKQLGENNSASNHNFLMETLPEDKDIIGKKYWNNKDVTNQKLASNYSLGTIKSSTKTVKIECRDFGLIDGDRIQIYLNEQTVSTNIGLKGNYFIIYLDLQHGYNRIDFQALNQGYSGPNTAEMIVYDDNGNMISAKEWNLRTNETATLGIIKTN